MIYLSITHTQVVQKMKKKKKKVLQNSRFKSFSFMWCLKLNKSVM